MTEDEPPSRWTFSWYWLAVAATVVFAVALAGGGTTAVVGASAETPPFVAPFDGSALDGPPVEFDGARLSPFAPTLVADFGEPPALSTDTVQRQFDEAVARGPPGVHWESHIPFLLPFGTEALLDGASASAFWAWLNAGTLRIGPLPPFGQDRHATPRSARPGHTRQTGATSPPEQERPGVSLPPRQGQGQGQSGAVPTEIQSGQSDLASEVVTAEVVLTASAVMLSLVGASLLLYDWLTASTDRDTEEEPKMEPDLEQSRTETDRERVTALLDENGGRMRQKEIVDHVDWSKAKVSRVLSRLESEDVVVKLRLGRENLVCLPGHEPVAFQSLGRREDGTGDE